MWRAFVCLLCLCLTTGVAVAQSVSQQKLTEYLDNAWKPSVAKQTEVTAQYRALKQTTPGDTNLEQAYLLLLIRQRMYQAAYDQATSLHRTLPNDVYTLRAKIYVALVQKNHDAALLDLENLAKALVTQQQPPLSKEQARELAEFTGRSWAFIQGPSKTELTQPTIMAAERRIVEKLGPHGEPHFRSGVQALAEKYAALDQELKQTKAETIQSETEQKEKMKVQLAEEKVNLGNEQIELDTQLGKLRATYDGQVRAVEAQLAPAQQQLAQAESIALAISNNVLFEDGQIANWLNIANNAANPFEYNQAIAQVRAHELIRNQELNKLAGAQAQAGSARSRVQDLSSQRQNLISEFNSEANPLQKRLKEISGAKVRIANDEKKAQQPSTGSTTQTTSLSSKVYSYVTYEDYPFEQEKQRLIESVR
jgi:regulator of sirC expression with transglutaminase-like and TPR domain